MNPGESVARKMMGLREVVILKNPVDLRNTVLCPFREGCHCKIMYATKGVDDVDAPFFLRGHHVGYRIDCETAPPECPLRFGSIEVTTRDDLLTSNSIDGQGREQE